MTIDTTKLRELAQKAETIAYKFDPEAVIKLLEAIDAMEKTIRHMRTELENLRTIEAAARNLAKVKGRHNSEIAMNQLVDWGHMIEAAPQPPALSDERILHHLDAILKASGSGLKNYSMHKPIDEMKQAIRAIEREILGENK